MNIKRKKAGVFTIGIEGGRGGGGRRERLPLKCTRVCSRLGQRHKFEEPREEVDRGVGSHATIRDTPSNTCAQRSGAVYPPATTEDIFERFSSPDTRSPLPVQKLYFELVWLRELRAGLGHPCLKKCPPYRRIARGSVYLHFAVVEGANGQGFQGEGMVLNSSRGSPATGMYANTSHTSTPMHSSCRVPRS